MSCYALIRWPHSSHAYRLTQSHGETEEIESLAALNGKSGFVIAPFAISADCPILLIKPDRSEEILLSKCNDNVKADSLHPTIDATERQLYAHDFAIFHEKLSEGRFSKIVLSRISTVTALQRQSPEQLFLRACQLYPRMFIALVSTRKSGTWLMATPEILIEGSANSFATMALAGSMHLSDSQMAFDTPHSAADSQPILWDEKNRHEQAIVASYIGDKLRQFSDDVSETPPYTVRAGRMVHLRSDFHFHIDDTNRLGDIIDSLHPTPAVCGLPKQEALQFILNNESCARKYYSGFCGLLCYQGMTRLYVSLRCMQIEGQKYVLHAGGGLLRESVEAKEWQETQDKMDTMRMVLQGNE